MLLQEEAPTLLGTGSEIHQAMVRSQMGSLDWDRDIIDQIDSLKKQVKVAQDYLELIVGNSVLDRLIMYNNPHSFSKAHRLGTSETFVKAKIPE